MSTEFAIIPLTIGTAIWNSIAGHHTNLAYGIFEFADNGISSFAGRGTALIVIFIQQLNESGDIMISVEDNGTGLQDINTAMSLGKVDKSLNTLNMYGMGTKQALASINPSNDNWTICSRTEADVSAGVFKRIKAPYSSEIFYGEIVDDNDDSDSKFLTVVGCSSFYDVTKKYDLLSWLKYALSSSKGIIAKDIDKIGEVLEIEPEIRTSVVAGLVKIICKSKDNGTYISPLRTHLFFRNVSGIWGCSDPHCPHVNEQYQFEGRSIGTMYKRPRNVWRNLSWRI